MEVFPTAPVTRYSPTDLAVLSLFTTSAVCHSVSQTMQRIWCCIWVFSGRFTYTKSNAATSLRGFPVLLFDSMFPISKQVFSIKAFLQIILEKEWLEVTTPAFKYRGNQELSASRYMSKTSSRLFDGSGYAHDFDVKDLAAFDNITKLLEDYAWVDAGTRLIMLELSLYSPATDLVTSAFFMVLPLSVSYSCVQCIASVLFSCSWGHTVLQETGNTSFLASLSLAQHLLLNFLSNR